MAKLEGSYDPGAVEAGGDFEAFVVQNVVASIIESEEKANDKGTGRLLSLTWKIAEGEPFAGRQIFQNLNYIHDSAQAQLIGQQQLKQVCEAVGVEGHLEDSEILHHTPCLISTKIAKDKAGQYPDKTEISRVKPLNAEAPAGKSPAPQNSAAASAATNTRQATGAKSAAPAQAGNKAPAKPAGNRPWQNKGAAATG